MNAPGSARLAVEPATRTVAASYWRALRWYAVSRVVLAALLFLASRGFHGRVLIEISDPARFRSVAFVYLVLGLGYLAAVLWTRPRFQHLVDLQFITDLVAIVVLMTVAGGIRGGLGVLVVASVAAAAVVSSARIAALYAAGAALGLLAETSVRALRAGVLDAAEFLLTGIFGTACFVVALAVSSLARRLSQQEALAQQRGEDLRNQLAVTHRVIAELDIGVIVMTAEGRVRTMNRAARQLVGSDDEASRERAALEPPPLEQVLGPAWRGLSQLCLDWRARAGDRPYEGVFAPQRSQPHDPASRLRLRLMRARPAADSDAVLLVEDMRELELRAQQLKLASMGRLSASIAHEIRNPLAAIRHANGLLAEALDAPGLQRLARIVEDNTVRIDRTIEDVLSISRRDAGPGDEQVDLASFLPAFVEEFLRDAGLGPDRVAIRLGSSQTLAFDSNHLRRVLANLLGNAVRHASQRAGAVSVEWLDKPDGRPQLRVIDDGPGMSDEAQRHAFEPFFTTAANGTGLGLYLVRELCSVNDAAIRYARCAGGCRGGGFVIEPGVAGSDADG